MEIWSLEVEHLPCMSLREYSGAKKLSIGIKQSLYILFADYYFKFKRVTSVTGHVFSMDFPAAYQRWDSVDPVELFSAPVISSPEGKGGIVKHLEREGS